MHQLIIDIQHESGRLIKAALSLKESNDLIAYQIGWGKCLIRWYEEGLEGKMPAMPGEGFTKWDYNGLAKHFHEKYRYGSIEEQLKVFKEVVERILEIVQTEEQKGRLDLLGVWQWCSLPSGKPWPLSKWVRVNTAAPYKRAVQALNGVRRASGR